METLGPTPSTQAYRIRDRNGQPQIVIDLLSTTASAGVSLPGTGLGARWQVSQLPTTPPAVRLTLSLPPNSGDWRVVPLGQGGILVLPRQPQAMAAPAAVTPQVLAAQAAPPPTTSPQQPRSPQVAQTTIVLDPGHGGADPGAIGIAGLQEKGVVMAITRQAAATLEAAGIAVVLTRPGDQDVGLQHRVDTAETAEAQLFVSIHANAISLDRPDVNGLETYYYTEAGARLAQVIHRQVLRHMELQDRGIKQARFFVLRRTSMPAVLIETGFVTGAIDAPRLRDPRWQNRMGQAIAAGILTYLQQQP